MLFDTETLEPLYKFSLGQPGSSFTFEVAQINGISLELIEDAKTRLDERKVTMDRLLSELQKEKTYLERLNKEHVEAQRLAQKAKQEYEDRKNRYDERLRIQQEVIDRNNKSLNAGKKMLGFIDKYAYKSRKKDINRPLIDELTNYLKVEKAKIEEQKIAVKLKSEVNTKNPKKVKIQKPEEDPYQRHKIVVGSTVKLISTKQNGTVESILGENITVTFGFLRMKVDKDKLMWVK